MEWALPPWHFMPFQWLLFISISGKCKHLMLWYNLFTDTGSLDSLKYGMYYVMYETILT